MYSDVIIPRIKQQRLLHDVTLELTYGCNLDCFYCYNDRDKVGKLLSLAQYRTLLEDLASMETLFLMLSGGEPMLHPHFFEIGAMTRELGFVTRIRTNGHSLGRRNAKRLRDEVEPYMVEVSLHGADAATHDRQTRVAGSFDRLVANLRGALEIGLRCNVVTTPTAWNEHQIDEMFALCDSLGVLLRFQGPVAPRDNGDTEPLIIQPSPSVWEEISKGQAQRRPHVEPLSIAPSKANQEEEQATCGVGVAGVDVDPYGNVQACMHLQRSAGSLHEHSIEEIWQDSPVFRQARERAVAAAKQFENSGPQQMGAPLFCIAVDENCSKGCGGSASHTAGNSAADLIRAIDVS